MDPRTAPPRSTTNGDATDVFAEIDRVFALQHEYQPFIRRTTAPERVRKLQRLRAKLLERRQDLRDALHADFRKPPTEVDLTELMPVLLEIKHASKHLADWMQPKKVSTPVTLFGTSSEIRYEPKGVGLIISPWNYPINLTLGPLVGAIAAGCSAILKPSEHTPHATRLMKELLGELFDEREVAVFEGEVDVAQHLLDKPFHHIYFTGSPEVGKIVMRAAAEHLASVTLELGGKSPTIVDETADIDDAARKITYGKFANKGQTCIAPDYVYVHERVHDAFVEALQDNIHDFYGPDAEARASSKDYARIIHEKHHRRLEALYAEALEQGARSPVGQTQRSAPRFIDPTVLTDVPAEARIMQEEIFGPLLPVLPYQSLDDALDAINAKPRPLALYIFSEDEATIERVLNHTTAGGTSVNDTLLHYMHPELPFGGVNTSGIGKGYGYYGFLAFSNERPVLRQKLKRSPFQQFYPPYTKVTQKLVNLLVRYF
ncbi:MAG: aldehyde dehydrogenase family protein [Bacteroidetes bacterium]|jgi:aldehyde dehydrogenase (NAD+)|nr:aldehyde dehydrogenase family protein [Bacteroidota bacterium]